MLEGKHHTMCSLWNMFIKLIAFQRCSLKIISLSWKTSLIFYRFTVQCMRTILMTMTVPLWMPVCLFHLDCWTEMKLLILSTFVWVFAVEQKLCLKIIELFILTLALCLLVCNCLFCVMSLWRIFQEVAHMNFNNVCLFPWDKGARFYQTGSLIQ